MRRITLHKLLLVVGAALVLYGVNSGQSTQKPHDEQESTPPIELKEITLEYDVEDNGKTVTNTVKSDSPEIPADAKTLRIKAKVINRAPKSRIRLFAALQELCHPPDAGKAHLNKLRHLTENEKPEELNSERLVTIELPVHCDDCVAISGCNDPCDRNHLGEGPHQITVTASDTGTVSPSRTATSMSSAKPGSVRFMIKSVCPKEKKPK